MELLTEDLKKSIPQLEQLNDDDHDPMVYAVFYMPLGVWEWWAIALDSPCSFYGLEFDDWRERWGSFQFCLLESLGVPGRLEVRRQTNFTPTRLSQMPRHDWSQYDE